MSVTFSTSIESGIEQLRVALEEILGADFEDNLREAADGCDWYDPRLPLDEVYRLWIYESITRPTSREWIFDMLRMVEQKQLCERVGITEDELVGLDAAGRATRVLTACDLPITGQLMNRRTRETLTEIQENMERGEDAKAATLTRQWSERLLAELLFFYASSGYGEPLIAMLDDPGKLSIPAILAKALETSETDRVAAVCTALRQHGWTELGFLNIALAKFSKRLQEGGAVHPRGAALSILTSGDSQRFDTLAQALRPYAHHNPSLNETREEALASALVEIEKALGSMEAREVIPCTLTVTATAETFLGRAFYGQDRSGTERLLHVQSTDACPSVGQRVLFIASSAATGAQCLWSAYPWDN